VQQPRKRPRFREGIASNPKIKIVAHREAKWLKEDATQIMQQWISQYPKIDVVYARTIQWRSVPTSPPPVRARPRP
jgi:hypothetical protein